MKIVGLAWCSSILFALLALMHSLISWAPPGPGPIARALPAVFAVAALIGFFGAIGIGRWPPTAAIRRSLLLRRFLMAAVLAELLLLVLIGG